ncbi:MAG: hypothetical protein JSS14_28495 [Proteobacteria bacterium]|nr:hypothetical protein [Pseudomonadota bacterium]
MHAHHPLRIVAPALALGLALASMAGCNEPQHPPSAMALVQAASNPDGDGQQASAGLTGGSLREQFQMYFGERFADQERELVQQRPQVARADVPTF